jgi:hypothetical protein
MATPADQVVARLLKMLPPLELLRIAEMPEASRLSGLSGDTLEREHPDKIVRLAKRRKGMRVAHALMLRELNELLQSEIPPGAPPPRRRECTV